MQFVEHIRILIFALLIFSAVFLIAYTLEMTRLWIASLAVIAILAGAIAVLARWSGYGIEESE
jgi:hypothetical protein